MQGISTLNYSLLDPCGLSHVLVGQPRDLTIAPDSINPCPRQLSGKYDAKRGDHFLQADFPLPICVDQRDSATAFVSSFGGTLRSSATPITPNSTTSS